MWIILSFTLIEPVYEWGSGRKKVILGSFLWPSALLIFSGLFVTYKREYESHRSCCHKYLWVSYFEVWKALSRVQSVTTWFKHWPDEFAALFIHVHVMHLGFLKAIMVLIQNCKERRHMCETRTKKVKCGPNLWFICDKPIVWMFPFTPHSQFRSNWTMGTSTSANILILIRFAPPFSSQLLTPCSFSVNMGKQIFQVT